MLHRVHDPCSTGPLTATPACTFVPEDPATGAGMQGGEEAMA